MSKFPLDLSKFKKVRVSNNASTLRSPEGHEIKIAHSALSPKFRDQLHAMPINLADGTKDEPVKAEDTGPVKAEDSAPDDSPTVSIGQPDDSVPLPIPTAAPDAPAQPIAANAPGGDVTPPSPQELATAQAQQPDGTIPQQPDAPAAQAPAPAQPQAAPPDQFGNQAASEQYIKGINAQQQGITGEKNALQAQSHMEAQALTEAIQNQQLQAKTYQDHYNQLDSERQAVQNDIQNQHIDPSHYLNSMGTGQRIATGIGLILGGFGSGLAHQQNLASNFLDDQINRDIDAQKADLGKKQNLLSANLQQFGNLKDATLMTKVMQNDIVSNQLKQAAAKTGDQMAASRALQQSGKLDTDSANAIGQFAMKRTLLSGMQNGTVSPDKVVNFLVPENQRAEANKELTTAQNMATQRDNLLSAFDQLTKLNTLGNRITSPIQTPKQVAAIEEPLLAQLVKDSEGRVTPQDTEMIRPLFSGILTSKDTVGIKRAQLDKFITEKMHFPILQSYGINIGNTGRFNNSGAPNIVHSPPVINSK